MQDNLNLAVIYGSARPGRRCDIVGGWVANQAARYRPSRSPSLAAGGDRCPSRSPSLAAGGFALDLIDPAAVDPADEAHAAALRTRIGRADAFIVVTPEYNHSYPAPLKAVIDAVNAEWHAKPVGFVSYGGISGGIRAVEHLRQVFAELHAVGLRDGVAFANVWERFTPDGTLRDPEPANAAMATMLARLAWWAQALRAAREAHPYAEAAA
jgi:NAD(P)H-dependent FMN reductase